MFLKKKIKEPIKKDFTLRGQWNLRVAGHNCEGPITRALPNGILVGTCWTCPDCSCQWMLSQNTTMSDDKFRWKQQGESSPEWVNKRHQELLKELEDAITMNTIADMGENVSQEA